MENSQESLFNQAMERYQSGAPVSDVIGDFEAITASTPNQSAGWTCLAWLQLLSDKNQDALRSARMAVKLNAQDPQARINLSLALLETGSKGVRDHIEFVKRILITLPDFEKELRSSLEDGLKRKPGWQSLLKVQQWLEL